MDGLLIKEKWLDLILKGKKTWEMRSRRTNKSGRIGLIQSGSGKVFGEAELVECKGPLSTAELKKNSRKHRVSKESVGARGYKYKFAWVLKNVKKYKTPKKYRHKQGAVIWVKLK